MKLWMDVMRDIEHVLDDYPRIFDAWEAGGVTGLVIGPLFFDTAKLLPGTHYENRPLATATFDPDPAVYRRFDVAFPEAARPEPDKRRRFEQMLANVKDRGWSLWLFQASAGAGPEANVNPIYDSAAQRAVCARMIDTVQHYPMADGVIMDGPEWGYEIAPHHMNHRSYIFHDLPEAVAETCHMLGYDYAALVNAKDTLYKKLHTLRPRDIRAHAGGGFVGTVPMLGDVSGLADWMQFRIDSLTGFFQHVQKTVTTEIAHPLQFGVGPRTAAFAPLCGYDYVRLAEFIDVLLPKFYFFHRGFDGMMGTIYRYVETLVAWNPGLDDQDALTVVQSLFGLALPGIARRSHFETALSEERLHSLVQQETRRTLAAVDDVSRIVPWVDTGRWPHDGDPMPARDLHHILKSAENNGLQQFLYHHHGNLTAGEWTVISEICGETWYPSPGGYQPPDMAVL